MDKVCECIGNVRGPLDPEIEIGVYKGHEFVGHHQHLLNHPRPDGIISQYNQKVKPPRADYLVREYEVLLW